MVILDPLPVVITPPGFRVSIHVPPEGKPFNTTLPVARSQVGWVTAPTSGAAGTAGGASITTSSESDDTHPSSLVTVKL